jgi:hypothetical protein
MYEAVESVEYRDRPGTPPVERILGSFAEESDAVEIARAAYEAFRGSGSQDYAWWVVRQAGARLARWIVDSRSGKEYVLDIRTGQLVEV